MSDAPQAPDWWQASDLKWYPPQDRPASAPRRRWVLPSVLLVVVALVAGLTTFVVVGGDEAEAVLLEPVSTAGPDPFSESVAVTEVAAFPDAVNAVVAETIQELPTDEATGTLVAVGDTPGLYGGTGDDESCDVGGLARYLADPANADKAAAWTAAMGVGADDVDATLESLTSTLLTTDTRVTNNGFANGRATPRQSVLQAGTAVLVDQRGVPRVRCSCGNPLAEPAGVDLATTPVTGTQWAGYSTETVTTPEPAPAEMTEVTLVDIRDAEIYQQPVGSQTGTTWVATSAHEDGPGGSIYTSPDGVDWVRTAAAPVPLDAVAHGGGRFVAAGGDERRGVALVSTDGITWSEPVDVGVEPIRDLTFGDGRWVAVSATRAYTSDDGEQWQAQPPISLGEGVSVGTVTFGDRRFTVATERCGGTRCVGHGLLTSPDGISWTQSPITTPNQDAVAAPALAHQDRLGAVGEAWSGDDGAQSPGEDTTPFASELVDDRWQPLTPTPADLRLSSLSTSRGSWFSVGVRGDATGGTTGVHTSRDLASWTQVGSIDDALTDVVVAPAPADAPAPTEQTTTTTPTPSAQVVLGTTSMQVADASGQLVTFDNGAPTGPLLAALQGVLGPPDRTEVDDSGLCGPTVTFVEWGDFTVAFYGPTLDSATGFIAILRGPDERIGTEGGITVGSSFDQVRAAFPDAATGDLGTAESRIMLDPDPTGSFGVVIVGSPQVTGLFAPWGLDQYDLC